MQKVPQVEIEYLRDQPVRHRTKESHWRTSGCTPRHLVHFPTLETTPGRGVSAAGAKEFYTSLLNETLAWGHFEFKLGVLLSIPYMPCMGTFTGPQLPSQDLQRRCVGCISMTATNGVALHLTTLSQAIWGAARRGSEQSIEIRISRDPMLPATSLPAVNTGNRCTYFL